MGRRGRIWARRESDCRSLSPFQLNRTPFLQHWYLHTIMFGLLVHLRYYPDNACVTSQGCRFDVSFTGMFFHLSRFDLALNPSLGSGVTLKRIIITTIPIPLNATVTIDGLARPSIVIPDGSPAAVVYDLQSLEYGPHSMRVTLVSYDGVASHFRLDSITVSEVMPPPPKLSSTTVSSTSSGTTSITATPTSTPRPANR
jgi:hypothetical protein